ACLIVGGEQLLRRMDFVDVLPSSTTEGLEEGREADIAENFFPVQGVNQIAHRLLVGIGRKLLVGKNNGARDRNPDPGSQGVIEKLVIRAPPKGVVDDDCSAQDRVLQVGAIEG